MTEHNTVFVDRRNSTEVAAGLATPILFWYDTDRKGRKRTNGVAVTMDGHLMVARAVCSKKDQFVKAGGRLRVTGRLLGNAQRHCWKLPISGMNGSAANNVIPEMAARAYEEAFPGDTMGHKRAYNAGNVASRYLDACDVVAKDILEN